MDKISVIIPIYKVEAYLKKCVDTVINQTYENLEILLVDDGSPDSCPEICDEYRRQDPRIKVIHQQNKGLSAARNAGLDVATGEFIAFVDSDDWLELDMYEKLYKVITDKNAEVAGCDIYYCKEHGRDTYSLSDDTVITKKSQKDFFAHIIGKNPFLRFEVWNKLFRRSVIGDIRFKEGQIYEDIFFERNVLQNVKTYCFVNLPLYNYRVSRNGSTNSYFTEKRYIIFEELNETIVFLRNKGWEDLVCSYSLYAMDICLIFYITASDLKAGLSHRNRIVQMYRHYYRQANKPGLKAKYRIFRHAPVLYYYISKALH